MRKSCLKLAWFGLYKTQGHITAVSNIVKNYQQKRNETFLALPFLIDLG